MKTDPKLIIKHVAEIMAIKEDLLYANTQSRTVVDARHTAIYLIRVICGYSYQEIAAVFGKDPQTIRYAIKRVEKEIGEL